MAVLPGAVPVVCKHGGFQPGSPWGIAGAPELSDHVVSHRGAFVKLRDKQRHPECYVCSDCGTNLKQKGHFFVEDCIYCETHARERVTPPEGYEVVTVFPK